MNGVGFAFAVWIRWENQRLCMPLNHGWDCVRCQLVWNGLQRAAQLRKERQK